MANVTHPGQRNDVRRTFVFHFSPPKAKEENKSIKQKHKPRQVLTPQTSVSTSSSPGRDLHTHAMMPAIECPTVYGQVQYQRLSHPDLVLLMPQNEQPL